MTYVLLILFTITFFYLAIANRLDSIINLLVFQGVLLFGMAFIELRELHVVNLVFVLLETIVFKTIAIPVFLRYVIRKNNLTRESEPFLSNFVSLIIITLMIVIVTFIISNAIHDTHVKNIFFVVALSTLFTGLYLIVSRRMIITHVMGFLVIENGVFILTLAVGNEMPALVNIGILLDIFVTALLLGIFVNKIGDVLKDMDVNKLRKLKD